jgi:uncharacterized phage-associated protein
MATAADVAAYLVQKYGPMPQVKLQKLLYYCQAWYIVWSRGEPLFPEAIEAWANGPVVPEVWRSNRYQYLVEQIDGGQAEALDKRASEAVDAVMGAYGNLEPQALVELTHTEIPWKAARGDLSDGQRGSGVISPQAMLDFYRRLLPDNAV